MKTEKRDFDKAAASWDEKPLRVKLAEDVANTIVRQVTISKNMTALDFGCGTGLLTLQLQPLVQFITGVDSSQGMLDIFNAKIASANIDNVCTLFFDSDKGSTLMGQYDFIVSSMTLHHIKEIATLLAQCYTVLAPGGTLCLADLDLDDGQFHDDSTGVFHNGFDRGSLRRSFTDAGFSEVWDVTAAKIEKKARDGQTREFPVFLMTGRKK
jgi:2-polyprenyl-3-methyl-5-hydroxy-6-metoxy-1,4-benzoquinol methylase